MGFIERVLIVLTGLVGVIAIGLIAVLAGALYDAMTAETFALRKDAWTCERSHTELVTTLIGAGKGTLVPITAPTEICDQWNRK